MKYRESGMPNELLWSTFFDPTDILAKMEINKHINVLIDIGCGYGTFLFSAATFVSQVIGIDIDSEMIRVCREKVKNNHLSNIKLIHGDICNEKTLKMIAKHRGKVNYITLFNILHCEEPIVLLRKTTDLLTINGILGIIHWKYETTPRGPSMEIRPKPQMIIEWATQTGLELTKEIDFPPYHFGLVFKKVSY